MSTFSMRYNNGCPRLRAAFPIAGLLALVLAAPVSLAQPADMDEIVRNPVIGNYKGYAEFKMANYGSARRIWEALAQRGNAEAHFNLGILHEDGLGVPVDVSRAVGHFEQSASGGNAKAQYRLGLLYFVGGKLARDDDKALRWLAAAAEQGDADAARLMRAMRGADLSGDEGEFLRADTLRVLGRHAEAAAIWTRLARDSGHMRARTRLAWAHEAGQGVPRDLAEAARLFRRSAEEGDAEAQYALAVMLQTGKGQERDPVQARRWLERAAAAGHSGAKSALAAPAPAGR